MSNSRNIATPEYKGRVEALRVRIDQFLAELVSHNAPRSLYEPVVHVLCSKGKRLRPVLAMLTAEGFGVPHAVSLPAAAALEVFHNFTLVHDDIMDASETRRGQPTIHVRWGTPAGILAGDFLLGMSYELLTRLPEGSITPALTCFSQMVVELCEGQAMDAEFEASDEVTVEDYLDMISRKTGALISASLKIGGILGAASNEQVELLVRAGRHVGRAFQIQDDLLDLTAESPDWGKPIGADLISGKRAFLLLKAVEIESERGGSWFRNLMEKRGADPSDVQEIRMRMERIGVLEMTRSVILQEYDEALDALEYLEREIPLQPVRHVIEGMRTRIR